MQESPAVYLDDAAVLMLAVDGDLRTRLLAALAEHVKSGGSICTSAAALATVQDYFLKSGDPVRLRSFWNGLDGLFREILPVRGEDLGRALDLIEEAAAQGQTLSGDQALHAAIVLNHRLAWLCDVRETYGVVPGIKAFEF